MQAGSIPAPEPMLQVVAVVNHIAMFNLLLIDPALNFPFASVSTDLGISDRITAACASHFKQEVDRVDASYFKNFSTIEVVFANGESVYIDVDVEEPDAPDEAF